MWQVGLTIHLDQRRKGRLLVQARHQLGAVQRIVTIVSAHTDKSNMKNGYTLIELLIVITIIALFSGLSLAYYNNFSETKKLDADTAKFLNVIELARKKAVSSDASMCSGPNITPAVAEYNVNLLDQSSYQLAPNCTTGSANNITYSLATNIIFPDPVVTLAFYPLTGAAPGCVILKNNTLSTCKYINVEQAGTACEGKCASCATCACPSSCH